MQGKNVFTSLVASAIVLIVISWLRIKRRNAIAARELLIQNSLGKIDSFPLNVPFSQFLRHVEQGLVSKVTIGRDAFKYTANVAASSSSAAATTAGEAIISSSTSALQTMATTATAASNAPAVAEEATKAIVDVAGSSKLSEAVKYYITRPISIYPGVVEFLHQKGVAEFDQEIPIKSMNLQPIMMMMIPFVYLAALVGIYLKFSDADIGKLNDDPHGFQGSASEAQRPTTFADVAGIDDAKAIVQEVSDILKNPGKYVSAGARLPCGILLVGPPGTGKTMMARAIANEVGIPFFYCSGSDFVEVFAGRGAARIRKLFEKARKSPPAIIFFDEIDALGKSRSGGHELNQNEEREQTLNQLLAEMDGFASEKRILVIAATNRYDVLDKALVRPGRFDRVVKVKLPNAEGREAILKVHTKQMKLSEDVKLFEIALKTDKFTGAELAMLANEAAIHAVSNKRELIEHADFLHALRSFNEARGTSNVNRASGFQFPFSFSAGEEVD